MNTAVEWALAILLTPFALLILALVLGALDEWGEEIITAILGLAVIAAAVALVHAGIVVVSR